MLRSDVNAFQFGAMMVSGLGKAIGAAALVAMLLATSAPLLAQRVDWIGYGPGGVGDGGSGSSAHGIRPIALDANGNSILAGWVRNENNLDPMVIKYGPDGNVQWQRRLDTPEHSSASSVVVDPAGDVLMFANANNYPEFATYLVKYSTTGEQRWSRRLTDTSGSMSGFDIAVDGQGNGYLLFGKGDDPEDGVGVSRFRADGEALWTVELPGHGDSTTTLGAMLQLDSNGNAYVCESIVTREGYRPAGYSLAKILVDGSLGWHRAFEGSLSCSDFGIDQQSRLVVVSASPQGLAAFQFDLDGAQRWNTVVDTVFVEPKLALSAAGDLTVVSGNYMTSPSVVRIDGRNGQTGWVRAMGPHSHRQRVSVDADGMAYVVAAVYDLAASNTTITGTKFDAAGTIVWSVPLVAPPVSVGVFGFESTATTPAGRLLVVGSLSREDSLLARQYNSDGTARWAGTVLPQVALPQRAQMGSSYAYKQALVNAGDGYFTNSVVWNGWRWDCHVDRFSGAGALLWSHSPATPVSADDCSSIEIAADRSSNHYIAQFLPATCPVSNSGEHFVLNQFGETGSPGWQRIVWQCADPQRPQEARIATNQMGIIFAVGRSRTGKAIVAFAPNGDELWRRSYGFDFPYAADIPGRFDAMGNIVIAGPTTSHFSVAKISSQGSLIWQTNRPRPLGDQYLIEAKDLAIGSNGDIAVTIRQSHRPDGFWSLHVVETVLLAGDGTERWSRFWSSPIAGQDDAGNVVIDSAGNVVVSVTSLPYIDPYTPRIGSAVVIRYGRGGDLQWERFLQPGAWAGAETLAVDHHDNPWMVMDSFEEGHGEQFVVAKLATDGSVIWTTRVNPDSLGASHSSAAVMTPDGDLVLSATVNEFTGADKLALVRLTERPRADAIFVDGFDEATTPASARGASAPTR